MIGMKKRTGNRVHEQTSPSPEVMIFGSGACAQKIAATLTEKGIEACLATSEGSLQGTDCKDRTQCLFDTQLVHCHGFAGNFTLHLKHRETQLRKTVKAIVVAEDDRRSPNFAFYGLTDGSRRVSLSDLEKKISLSMMDDFSGAEINIVFLCGWQKDAHPAVARRMLDSCLRMQDQQGVRTYFMTGNMKVAATGSEALVHRAKRCGTVFLKFTHDYPTIASQDGDGFIITYPDELTRENFQMAADWIVVDETIEPGHPLKSLIQQLEIDEDEIGFSQSDNVRRLSNATNRRGIFVAGGSRGVFSDAEQVADADQVSLRVLAFLHNVDMEALPEVTIQQGRCARCLTCYRLCPHLAIDIGSRITVVADACQSCGICMAGCPARAIGMEGVQIGSEIIQRMRRPSVGSSVEKPHIMIFGCSRSAGQAHALTRMSGYRLPEGVQFIEVPCGGAIAGRHLLRAFEVGADGVMLCTCHTGNCQSEIGNVVARKRAESTAGLLSAAGITAQRLRVVTVAANMGNEFAYQVETFMNDIVWMNNPSKENQHG